MNGFLPLNVYNTICPINKWCCLTMTMTCRKCQHGQPFPERCSQNGSKQTKNRKLQEALRSIDSLSNGCGIVSWSDNQCAREALPLVAHIMHTRHQVNVIICECY
jgi:hypothetical protein